MRHAAFLVVVPAAAAKNLSANLSRYALLSSIFGAVSAVAGILLASFFSHLNTTLPPGPLVVIAGAVIFGGTVLVRWRKRANLQELEETSFEVKNALYLRRMCTEKES